MRQIWWFACNGSWSHHKNEYWEQWSTIVKFYKKIDIVRHNVPKQLLYNQRSVRYLSWIGYNDEMINDDKDKKRKDDDYDPINDKILTE